MNGTPCSTQLIFAETQLEKAQIEIEALRQRVKWHEEREERARCLHCGGVAFELAALKQNGEPVAWYNSREIGSFITFSKVEHDKWPNLYNVALYAAPQTCYSAGDMADAAAKAAQVEREECAKVCESLYTGKRHDEAMAYDSGTEDCAAAIRMRGEVTK